MFIAKGEQHFAVAEDGREQDCKQGIDALRRHVAGQLDTAGAGRVRLRSGEVEPPPLHEHTIQDCRRLRECIMAWLLPVFQDTRSLIGFAIALSTNKSIQAVDLSRPLLFSHQVSVEAKGARVTAPPAGVIRHGTWSSSHVQEETMVHLAHTLRVNQHLQELHLGQHGMADSGVERLCEALRGNSVLHYLDLRW